MEVGTKGKLYISLIVSKPVLLYGKRSGKSKSKFCIFYWELYFGFIPLLEPQLNKFRAKISQYENLVASSRARHLITTKKFLEKQREMLCCLLEFWETGTTS